MNEFIYYILPNVVLFGGLWIFAKNLEYITWLLIENHEEFFNWSDK